MPLRVTPSPHLPRLHFFLALAVMMVWGSNFVVIKLALAHLPPQFLHEPLQSWKLAAAALVMGGLGITLLWPRFVRMG